MKLDIFLDCMGNIETIDNILTLARKDGFTLASDFEKEIPSAAELFAKFKKYYHGNSKMILHFFYNNITKRNEFDIGTKTIYRSYPQYKKAVFLKVV